MCRDSSRSRNTNCHLEKFDERGDFIKLFAIDVSPLEQKSDISYGSIRVFRRHKNYALGGSKFRNCRINLIRSLYLSEDASTIIDRCAKLSMNDSPNVNSRLALRSP